MGAANETHEISPEPADFRNAREYAIERLKAADEPISPANLADEYSCSSGHMRHVLCDLHEENMADRVRRGQYVAGGNESPPQENTNGTPEEAHDPPVGDHEPSSAPADELEDSIEPESKGDTPDDKDGPPADGGESEEPAAQEDPETRVPDWATEEDEYSAQYRDAQEQSEDSTNESLDAEAEQNGGAMDAQGGGGGSTLLLAAAVLLGGSALLWKLDDAPEKQAEEKSPDADTDTAGNGDSGGDVGLPAFEEGGPNDLSEGGDGWMGRDSGEPDLIDEI